MPSPPQFAAMATLLDSMRADVRLLRGLLRVDVAGQTCELPLAHTWQAIPGVPGVEMATLDPADWPDDARPDADYHLLRGPGKSQSPGVLKVPQSLRLEILAGHQRYWKESLPHFVDYLPGDVFVCAAGEGHQWQTLEPFRNRVSFSPALIARAGADPAGGCLTSDPDPL